jgi:hypothetical protein
LDVPDLAFTFANESSTKTHFSNDKFSCTHPNQTEDPAQSPVADMTRYTFIKQKFSSGYFVPNTIAGTNTICEYDLSDAISVNDPDLKWDGPKYSIQSTIVAVPPKFDLYVQAYLEHISFVDDKDIVKRMHNVLTSTIVEYYEHTEKHGIELYKYILSEFILESIYNMPNRYPSTRPFVDTFWHWDREIEIFDSDLARPFRDRIFQECMLSWRQPVTPTLVAEDLSSICQVLYDRSNLHRLIEKIQKERRAK